MLYLRPEKCVGCRSCELACSFEHYKENNPARALIYVVKEEEGIDYPVICQHCDDAPCIEVCPKDAIIRDPDTNAVKILRDECIGCRACINVCPFGAIFVDPKTGDVFKCDLCDGNPKCAEICPVDAIIFDSRKDVGPRLLSRSKSSDIVKYIRKDRSEK